GGSRVLPQSPAGIKTTIVRGQSPATGASASRTGLEFSKRETAAVAALTPAAVRRRAMAATVRLRVDDGDAFSYGTGTIVDVHQGEALILTCGHIFRDSRGKGAIEVDVFAGGAMRKVRGQLITYEPDYRDIGFVSFRSPVPLQPAPVAAQPNAAQPGAAAFSIGCDRGADPSIRETRVTTINRFQGAPNIETSGAPVLGRSGGGLFNNNGELIGVCKLAVPSDDEGIYSSLPSIHWHLDKLNLAHVYQRSIAQPVESTAPPMFAGTRADDRRSEPQSRQQRLGGIRDVVADSSELPRTRPAIDGAISSALSAAGDAEVICIIRRRNDPQGRSRIVRVDQASPELLAEIARAAQARSPSASLDRASRPLETAGRFDMPPVVRAQSGAESLKP
ncbi:MAG: serine protease, partial [Pirellulaceae bacterium]|nr:serine protease [Pirellulaceae bacterium]